MSTFVVPTNLNSLSDVALHELIEQLQDKHSCMCRERAPLEKLIKGNEIIGALCDVYFQRKGIAV